MADEYIKRSDVQDALHSAIIEWNKDCGIARMEYLRIRLNNVPAVDVAPVVWGKWKNAHPSSPMLDGGGPPYCSVCGEEAPMRSVEKNQWKLVCGRISGPEVVYSEETYLSNFCPNCGADMREKQNEP